MNLFQLSKNKVEVSPVALTIKEFKELWSRDKSKTKESATKEFSYIYFSTDWNSVYQNMPEEDRHETLKEDLDLGETWEPDHLLKVAIKKYEELQETPTMRYARSVRKAFWDMITYFEHINYAERDVKGQPVYKIQDVTKAMGDSGKLVESVKKLEAIVKKEQLESSRVRSGDELNPFEDPDTEI